MFAPVYIRSTDGSHIDIAVHSPVALHVHVYIPIIFQNEIKKIAWTL